MLADCSGKALIQPPDKKNESKKFCKVAGFWDM